MAYWDFKDLGWRTASDEILHDKAFKIAINPKYDGYQRELTSMVYKFFDQKAPGGVIENETVKQRFAEELHRPIIRNLRKEKCNHLL